MTPQTLAKDFRLSRRPISCQTALRACRSSSEVDIAKIAAAIGAGIVCLVGTALLWL